MSKAARNRSANTGQPKASMVLRPKPDETNAATQARTLLEPYIRHGLMASGFAGRALASTEEPLRLMESADYIEAEAHRAGGPDLSLASHLLTAQAITLDSMFTELGRCAALNLSDYPHAADRYARLALKAQAHCRATLEALAKLHQPREQTVRHVHVNDGGQAIVAEQVHHHATGGRNDVSAEQSHATASTGSGTKMLGQDAGGDALPVPSGEGAAAMPDARRNQSRRPDG